MNEQDYKDLILLKTGNHATVEENIDLIWRRFDGHSDLELRYSYALIDAIESLLGGKWEDYDITTASGQKLALSQPFEHLIEMCKRAQSYIDTHSSLEAVYGADSAPDVSEMTEYLPVPTPAGYLPDPNSTRYSGDPLALIRGQS